MNEEFDEDREEEMEENEAKEADTKIDYESELDSKNDEEFNPEYEDEMSNKQEPDKENELEQDVEFKHEHNEEKDEEIDEEKDGKITCNDYVCEPKQEKPSSKEQGLEKERDTRNKDKENEEGKIELEEYVDDLLEVETMLNYDEEEKKAGGRDQELNVSNEDIEIPNENENHHKHLYKMKKGDDLSIEMINEKKGKEIYEPDYDKYNPHYTYWTRFDEQLVDSIEEKLKKKGTTQKEFTRNVDGKFHNFSMLRKGKRIDQKVFENVKAYLINNLGISEKEIMDHSIMSVGKSSEPLIRLDTVENSDLIGIMVGDGSLSKYGARSYYASITLNKEDDRAYFYYVKKKIDEIFGPDVFKEKDDERNKAVELICSRAEVHEALTHMGLKPGNKIENNPHLPPEILNSNDEQAQIDCLREMTDTDGSIALNKNYSKFGIHFDLGAPNLAKDFQDLCTKLGIKSDYSEYEKSNDKKGFGVHIQTREQTKKFIYTVKPRKFYEPYRRKYLGVSMIHLNLPDELKDSIQNDIDQRHNLWHQHYTKKFTLDLKKTCENHIQKYNEKQKKEGGEGIKEIFGHHFKHKIKRQMIEKGIESNFVKRKMSFRSGENNQQEIHSMEKDFKLKIIDCVFDEFMNEKTKLLKEKDVLDSIKKKFDSDLWIYDMNGRKKLAIEKYVSKLISGVKHVVDLPPEISNNLSGYKIKEKAGGRRNGNDIVEIWKRRINNKD